MISFLRWVKDMKWLLSHEGLWMASEYVRKCSVSHTVRKRVNRNQNEASAVHSLGCLLLVRRERTTTGKEGEWEKMDTSMYYGGTEGFLGYQMQLVHIQTEKNEQIQQTSVLPVHGGTTHSSPDRGPSCLWLVDESTFRKEPCFVTSTGPWTRQAL